MTLTDKIKLAFPYVLLVAYGLFTCGYFFLSDYADHYRLYSRFVFIFGIFAFLPGLRGVWPQPLFKLVLLYMAYLLLSGFWAQDFEWFRLGQKTSISGYLLNFIAITWVLVQWNPRLFENMLRLSVLVAGIAATLSIIVFYQSNELSGPRMTGVGSLTNVNEFSNVYGVFALLGLGFALRTQSTTLRLGMAGAILAFITFAWFGQSRTAFVTMLFSLPILLGLNLKRRRLVPLGIASLIALGGVLLLMFPEPIAEALERGAGLRPGIWAGVWQQISTLPLTGHGLTSTLSVTSGKEHFETAHNAYLQVLWHGGVIGLLVFGLLFAGAFRTAWIRGCDTGDYTIFCIFLFTAGIMLTGVDTLIERPRDQWLLFWQPLALLLAYGSHWTRTTTELESR